MAYNNNTHESIIRQSMLKAAVDYSVGKDYTITQIIGIAMSFAEYAEHGTYETAKIVEKKLSNKS